MFVTVCVTCCFSLSLIVETPYHQSFVTGNKVMINHIIDLDYKHE